MRSRFHISTHATPTAAYQARRDLQRENPDAVYQVRRGREGARLVFRLVERLHSGEAKAINEIRNGPAKPKPNRKGWTRKVKEYNVVTSH